MVDEGGLQIIPIRKIFIWFIVRSESPVFPLCGPVLLKLLIKFQRKPEPSQNSTSEID